MDSSTLSRRKFFRTVRWAPSLLLPAPLYQGPLDLLLSDPSAVLSPAQSLSDFHLKPHYPSHSPLDDLLRLVPPGLDAYLSEKYVADLSTQLAAWSTALKTRLPGLEPLSAFLNAAIEFNSIGLSADTGIHRSGGISVRGRRFNADQHSGREPFLAEMKNYFTSFTHVRTAEFEITRVQQALRNPLSIETDVRYAIVGTKGDGGIEQRLGVWKLDWSQSSAGLWSVHRWISTEDTIANSALPIFEDITQQALGRIDSYRRQLVPGVDHWRSVMDGACGIDVYGNNGIAAGDFDNDGFDDLYICQPSGLPNRLYRNRGDGSFEDVTEKSGLGVLDATASAVFADFENKGLEDLLVVCASGPLLFLNQGNGKFRLNRDAFSFASPPQGTFTHAAVADYDHDGRLDVYFCLYSYYLGLDQYHYPSPYFDARNGPPNFLFHNEGHAKFIDRTTEAGLNIENDRFSFACAWGDINSNGHPDLYVANDFGCSNLYRNRGDGTFEAISDAASVNIPGAGMSASWCDYDNDGNQDIYVSNMWSAAGQRVSEQQIFHHQDSQEIQARYRRHARGNSLYRNSGDGRCQDVSALSGVEMGRWAWSSDFWDFDHDGFSDLYIANGYISGGAAADLGSFFWRQVVGNSPSSSTPALPYERGWNAINELIRSDATWAGYERNTFYLNNGNGTFSDISGIAGLDFLDDSRSFALADLDHDGRLEVILKNRNAPQLRILRNSMSEIGDAISFRLRGSKSNRDAIGAAVTVRSGNHDQTKYLQAGSGFLSQHSKELFFGLGKAPANLTATVRWPSGLTQTFEHLPVNHRVSIEEGQPAFSASPFVQAALGRGIRSAVPDLNRLPSDSETWLLDPVPAPDFVLPSVAGKPVALQGFRGKTLLLHFWTQASPQCLAQLKLLQAVHADLQILSINMDDTSDRPDISRFLTEHNLSLSVLLASEEFSGIYNLLYRYLFDRRRDLPLPSCFLVDRSGMIVKIYQGIVGQEQLVRDVSSIPDASDARLGKALPFPGTLYHGQFRRNAFSYGVALFQHGYLDQAAASFKQVVEAKPDDPEAYYNLGTLYLRKNDLAEAQRYLAQTVKLRPNYPEAWNNLGMIAGQQNHPEEAIRNFKQSLAIRPDYAIALVNLGNIYRRQGNFPEAAGLFNKAVSLEPDNPEANYSLGMLQARQNNAAAAVELLEKALRARPDYPEARNNLGVLFVRQGRRAEAEEQFKQCIEVTPSFDQPYLNLAQLYMLSNEKAKARAALESLLRLQPQHKLAQQALEMLN
jgi:Flp pilus assembly protein TadD/peroxiredoxin